MSYLKQITMTKKNEYTPQSISHLGETLKEKLEEMRMSIKEFADCTRRPEKEIVAIIKGKSDVTKDMAVVFEGVTKIPAHFWLNNQRAYNEFVML